MQTVNNYREDKADKGSLETVARIRSISPIGLSSEVASCPDAASANQVFSNPLMSGLKLRTEKVDGVSSLHLNGGRGTDLAAE